MDRRDRRVGNRCGRPHADDHRERRGRATARPARRPAAHPPPPPATAEHHQHPLVPRRQPLHLLRRRGVLTAALGADRVLPRLRAGDGRELGAHPHLDPAARHRRGAHPPIRAADRDPRGGGAVHARLLQAGPLAGDLPRSGLHRHRDRAPVHPVGRRTHARDPGGDRRRPRAPLRLARRGDLPRLPPTAGDADPGPARSPRRTLGRAGAVAHLRRAAREPSRAVPGGEGAGRRSARRCPGGRCDELARVRRTGRGGHPDRRDRSRRPLPRGGQAAVGVLLRRPDTGRLEPLHRPALGAQSSARSAAVHA